MKTLLDKIDKLIEQGSSFTWEECSYAEPSHGPDGVYGKEPSAAWNAWTSRIEHILERSVRPDSEPYIYFKTEKGARIKGNHRDQFDIAKDGYVGALRALKQLVTEGDIFNELLVRTLEKPESQAK